MLSLDHCLLPNHFIFWEGEAAPAGRRRKWLRSHLSFQQVLWNEAEVWSTSLSSSGWGPRCSRCWALWSCPWGGSNSCHSRDPCSRGGWHREAASAVRRTPGHSSTGRCNTPVERLQQFWYSPTCGKFSEDCNVPMDEWKKLGTLHFERFSFHYLDPTLGSDQLKSIDICW